MSLRTFPKLSILIICVPLSIFLFHIHSNSILLFIVSSLGIIGLICLMAKSTEQLSISSGPVVGGLLNASFGNFPELLICINSIRHGLHVLAKAAICGSIIGNILLTVGIAMIWGGMKYKTQRFSQTGTNAMVLMLSIALIAIVIPAFVNYGYSFEPSISKATATDMVNKISIYTAVVLFIVYILYLIFSLKTHSFIYKIAEETEEKLEWSRITATIVLLITAVLVAYESDIFVAAIKGMLASKASLFSELFMGVIFVAAISNAVGVGVSLQMARKNKMNLIFQVTMGASLQIALLVLPLVIAYSFLIAKPLNLTFNGLEIISLWACALISGYSLLDGESNWFEGVMFVAVYIILGFAFFFYP